MQERRALEALGLGIATVRPLADGLSSTAWLVEHESVRRVLRVAHAAGEDYRREHAVLAALHGAAVPEPIAGDWDVPGWAGPPFSLTSYLAGTPLDPTESLAIADDLADFLAVLHAAEPPPGLPSARDRFGDFGAEPDGRRVLVHSDLHDGNILRTEGGTAFLDFGCAFVGSPLWEYASLAFFLGWPLVDRILPAGERDAVRQLALSFASYRNTFPDDREHAAAFIAATRAQL